MRNFLFLLALLSCCPGAFSQTGPVIACPANLTIATAADACAAVVSYSVTASDDEPGWMVSQWSGLGSGAEFPAGVTVNEFRVVDASGNTATCSFTVSVIDLTPPVAACTDLTVSCESFDPSLWAYGPATGTDNCCIDTTVLQSVSYAQFDTVCNRGTIQRIFRATDCSANSSTCTQRITVEYEQGYFIRFPDDDIIYVCEPGATYGTPTFFGEDCELLGTSFEDEVFVVDSAYSYRIERTWQVINWCTYDPSLPLTFIPNPNPIDVLGHPANHPGPVVSACSALPPWQPTTVKTNPADPLPTNYCTFYDALNNGYTYRQLIYIVDNQSPVVQACPTGPQQFADTSANDPYIWNNVFNPAQPAQNRTETPLDLKISAADACLGADIWLDYQLFLDLDADGATETVVDSKNLPQTDTVFYGNQDNPGYTGGLPVAFDSRSVPLEEKWRFALQSSVNGANRTTSVRWNTLQAPNQYKMPELPAGTHRIRWIASDGLTGNETDCEYTFTVQAPPVVQTVQPVAKGGAEFAVYQNEPNPFSGETVIGFNLPQAEEVELTVFNASGRELYRHAGAYARGYHAHKINGNFIPAAGWLYYKIQTPTESAVRRMVLIR